MTIERGRFNSATENTAERTELIDVLRSQLRKLPELESQLLACSFGANMSHRQIGELFNLSQPAVGSKSQQALARLRSSLTGAGVATAVPLVNAENLFEAITTGETCPPGAAARALQHIDTGRRTAGKALSRRSGGDGRMRVGVGTMAIAACSVLAAGAAMAWSATAKPAVVPSTPNDPRVTLQ